MILTLPGRRVNLFSNGGPCFRHRDRAIGRAESRLHSRVLEACAIAASLALLTVSIIALIPDSPPAATVDVGSLHAQYQDRAAADRRYAGKVIELTGVGGLLRAGDDTLVWLGRFKGRLPPARVMSFEEYEQGLQVAGLTERAAWPWFPRGEVIVSRRRG